MISSLMSLYQFLVTTVWFVQQFFLFFVYLSQTASALQLLKSGTLLPPALQLFKCVPVLILFVMTTRPNISSSPPNPLSAFFLCFNLASTLLFFWHRPLGVRSTIRRHQSPQTVILSQIDCFVQCKVVGSLRAP